MDYNLTRAYRLAIIAPTNVRNTVRPSWGLVRYATRGTQRRLSRKYTPVIPTLISASVPGSGVVVVISN